MHLTDSEARFWQRYVEQLPASEVPDAPFVTAGPAGSPAVTDGLVQLYLEGTKTAGSSLLADFETAHDPVPQVGDYWIVLDSHGEPRCLLRTVRVELQSFRDVGAEVAIAEGEGDLSVAHWKRVHAATYAPHLTAWGISDLDEATVVTEFFHVEQ